MILFIIIIMLTNLYAFAIWSNFQFDIKSRIFKESPKRILYFLFPQDISLIDSFPTMTKVEQRTTACTG